MGTLSVPIVDWLQPGAFATDGRKLFEIVRVADGNVAVEDCCTEKRQTWRVNYFLGRCRLVRRAPQIPDSL